MKTLIIILIIIITIISSIIVKSQGIQFSQPYASPLYLCPSFSGSTDGGRLATSYRNQWSNYTTYSISYDHYLNKIKSGLGIILIKDMPGNDIINYNFIGLQYSYKITINRIWEIRPALQASYNNSSFDFSKFTFKEQLVYGNTILSDEYLNKNNLSQFDASASALIYSSKLWTGVTIDHLLMPDNTISRSKSAIPLKITAFGGKRFELAKSGFGLFKSQILTLTALYKQQQKFKQLDIGSYWDYRIFSLGMWYRGLFFINSNNNDALIFMTGLNFNKLRISYSFDLTVSKLTSYSGNSHEISLNYELFQNKTLQKKRFNKAIPSPKF